MRMTFALAILLVAGRAAAQEAWQPDDWHKYTRYGPAKFTQSIATRNNAPAIDKVPRVLGERRYLVPGGLESATGWRSDLYCWASSHDSGTYRIPVLNSFGNYQYERGLWRSWDDGSRFVDVLTNTATGKVFEVRVAIKGFDAPGRWRRFVDYRDASQQPSGYRRVKTSECRSCHSDAGSGGYAVGLAPGSDTVFSYPLFNDDGWIEEKPMRKTAAIAAPLMVVAALTAQDPQYPSINRAETRETVKRAPCVAEIPPIDFGAVRKDLNAIRADIDKLRELCVAQDDGKKPVPPPQKFKTGARRTPVHKFAMALRDGTATIHKPQGPTPAQVAMVPPKMSYLGNDQHGDCVSASEGGFGLQCYSVYVGLPEIPVSDNDVISFAQANGYLEGADLLSVLQTLQSSGIKVAADGKTYKCGTPASVNYADEASLQNAIAQGPVYFALDASDLPSGAGNGSGWYKWNGGKYPNTDHCMTFCGYGPKEYVFGKLNTPVPADAPSGTLYMIYTWAGIGVTDHAWIMNTVVESWLCSPCWIGLPSPGPGPGPGPTPTTGTITVGYPTGSTVKDDGKGTVTVTIPGTSPAPAPGQMILMVGEGVQAGTYTFTPAPAKKR